MPQAPSPNFILGIESSCDDTGVAVYDAASRKILSNLARSQDAVHAPFGGVVPELASRSHLENIGGLYRASLEKAGITAEQLGAIAVTRGPGLRGCLAVGVAFARGLGAALGKPVAGINHIRAHALSPFAESPLPEFPHLAAVLSGGHSHLFRVDSPRDITLLAKTRDDAMGEAFDKVAKLIGLPWPGGPAVDRAAREGNEKAFVFPRIKFNDGSLLDLSFSGLKTAALYRFRESGLPVLQPGEAPSRGHNDLCASFQKAAVGLVLSRVELLLDLHPFTSFSFSGGAAQNSRLRALAAKLATERCLPVFFPGPGLSADNGAMIAAAASLENRRDETEIQVDPDLKI
jgi:N6-L-threonylcarbamoyladenine synthase